MAARITGRDLVVFFLLGGVLGGLVAWALCYRWGSFPTVKPLDLPAWIQAIGSIVALGIAIGIPLSQARQRQEAERRSEQARCRLMVAALRQPVGTFANRCRIIRGKNDLGHFLEEKPVLAIFERPPEFDQFRTDLHLLGDLGMLINEVISDQAEAWIQIRALQPADAELDGVTWRKLSESFRGYELRARGCYEKLIAHERNGQIDQHH